MALLVILAVILIPVWFFVLRDRPQEITLARQQPTPRATKPPPSETAYPGFHPARYSIEAEYAEDPRSISGRQTLRYVNAEGKPMESLNFRLWTNEEAFAKVGGETKVSSVSVDGRQARFSADGTILKVKLPEPLPDGATASLVMDFETRIPDIAAPFGYSSGVVSLGVWHPVLAVHGEDGWNLAPTTEFGEPYFAEVADYEVRLTLPRNLTPVATGVETERSEDGEKPTFTYRADRVRGFALAIGEGFDRVSRKVGKTTVNVYHRPNSAHRAKRALDLASESLDYFSKLYGPYPYAEFDVVDAPLVAGTEYSTLAFTNLGTVDEHVFNTVIPHEVAHQWWYVQVGSDQFADPWLDEALATYSEWLFTGDAATRFPTPATPQIPPDSPVDAFPDTATYERVTYLYGAQLYRDLSNRIGEETLLQGLHDYAEDFRYKTATAQDLVETLSAAAGEDLTGFFADHGVTPDQPGRQ